MRRRSMAALVLAGSLLALAGGTAAAAQPVMFTVYLDSFVEDGLCAFPVEVSFTDPLRVTLYFDGSGNLIRELDTFPNFTVTFTHDDNVLTTKGPAVGITTFASDGSVDTIVLNGMAANITLPGHGHVLLDAGRIVFDGEGNIVAEDGPHQIFGTADAPAFCAAMA